MARAAGAAVAAALAGKVFAYLVWGVCNDDRVLVGTTFDPHSARVGYEELESWLLRLLAPKIDFRFFRFDVGEKPVVLLEIHRAAAKFPLFPLLQRGRPADWRACRQTGTMPARLDEIHW